MSRLHRENAPLKKGHAGGLGKKKNRDSSDRDLHHQPAFAILSPYASLAS